MITRSRTAAIGAMTTSGRRRRRGVQRDCHTARYDTITVSMRSRVAREPGWAAAHGSIVVVAA